MIKESSMLLIRLRALSDDIVSTSTFSPMDDRQRYIRSSADLIDREYDKLAEAFTLDDTIAIAWALRSIADMMKGLIDIGSNLPTTQPVIWQEAKSVANDAHHIELNTRQ